jgi:anti-anti-sigma factor
VTLENDSRLIRVVGEVDLATVDLLIRFLQREATHGESIALDLSGVGFMDSSGSSLSRLPSYRWTVGPN